MRCHTSLYPAFQITVLCLMAGNYWRLFFFCCTHWSAQCPFSSWKAVSCFSTWQMHKALKRAQFDLASTKIDRWFMSKYTKHVGSCMKLVVFAVYTFQTFWKNNYRLLIVWCLLLNTTGHFFYFLFTTCCCGVVMRNTHFQSLKNKQFPCTICVFCFSIVGVYLLWEGINGAI